MNTYSMVDGGPSAWNEQFKNYITAYSGLVSAQLVGVWYTDLGDHNTGKYLDFTVMFVATLCCGLYLEACLICVWRI